MASGLRITLPEDTPPDELRAAAILDPLQLILLALAPIYLLGSYLAGVLEPLYLFALLTIVVGVIISRLLLAQTRLRAASLVFLITWSSVVLISATVSEGISTVDSGIMLLTVFAAGLLLGPTATLWSSACLLIGGLVSYAVWPVGSGSVLGVQTSPASQLLNMVTSLIIGAVIAFFATRGSLEAFLVKQQNEDVLRANNAQLAREIEERRRAENALQRRVDIDRFTARIAADLLSTPLDDLDRVILDVLRQTGELAAIDRVQLFTFDEKVTHAGNSHEWCADGVRPLRPVLARIPLAGFHWAMARLRAFEPILIEDTAQVPAHAIAFAGMLKQFDVGATALLPLRTEDRLFGFLSAGIEGQRRRWDDDTQALLNFVAYVLATAMERRRQAEALVLSEQRYQLAATAGRSGIWDLDLKNNTFYMSDILLDLLGYSRGELDNRLEDWLALIHPADREAVSVAITGAVAGQSERFELVHRLHHKDGSYRWMHTTGHFSRDRDEIPLRIVGTNLDVTEQQRSERKLAYQANLLENISDAIVSTDLEERVRSWNQAAERIYGWSAAEAIGRKVGDLLPTVYWESDRKHAVATLQRDGVWSGLVAQTSKSGEPVHIQSSVSIVRDGAGQSTGMVAVNRDITQETHTQEALKLSELRFRSLVEQSPFSMMIFAADGRLETVNQAFRDLAVLPQDEIDRLIGSYNILNDAVLESSGALQLIRRGFGGEQVRIPASKAKEIRAHAQQSDQNEHWIVTHVYPVLNAMDRVREVVIIHEDVTEQKRTEAALNQAQKLESLGVLAGGVAHDFNNLLTAMLAQASLAQAKLTTDHAAQENIRKVVKAAERAATLTEQMLAYSGRGAFEVRPLDLNDIMRTNRHLLDVALPKFVALETVLEENLPPIAGDDGQLQQVVMNLLINGAEAVAERQSRLDAPPAGFVRLRTATVTIPAGEIITTITGDTIPAATYVLLEVEDNGSGMDKKTLSHIFDPFFSTKSRGRGLGLAAVVGIVRSHKAHLVVASAADQGTRFQIFFPTSSAPLPEAAPSAPSSEACPGRKHVLVIDDEAPVREAIADILFTADVAVLAAEDGSAGIALFRERQAEIGLVLLDLSMPGISGEETYRQLREIDREVAVVLSSGYSETETLSRFDGLGLTGFLQKPYGMGMLLATVNTHLR